MGEAVVTGTDVWKIYGTGDTAVGALQGINIELVRGEMVALVGPSGSGKTTFLNCFSGLDAVTKGSVSIEGTDLARMSDDEKSDYRARRTGFVFQSYNLLPVLTAVENVEIPLLVAGVKPAEARRRAAAILKDLGLGDRLEHLPSQLSGGQQQRVSLARALVSRPAILWADEPTGNLDEESSQQVITLLRQLNHDYHQTMVIVTHNEDVARACDRTVKVLDGRLMPGAGAGTS
jgi:putative ABC transport system ATP-binding protein